MSDTPETDDELNYNAFGFYTMGGLPTNAVCVEFARKLERERNEAVENNYQVTKMALEFRRELYAIKDANKTILELQKK